MHATFSLWDKDLNKPVILVHKENKFSTEFLVGLSKHVVVKSREEFP